MIIDYLKKISRKSIIYLLLFIITSVLAMYYINNGGVMENVVVKLFRHAFFLLFYFSLTKKPNPVIIFFIFMTMLVGVFLSIDPLSIIAMSVLCVYRAVLVWQILQRKKIKINRNYLKKDSTSYILILLLVVEFVILSVYRENSLFFSISVVAETILVIWLFFAFTELLKTTKIGNLELFIGIAIFVVSDAIFGTQRLLNINSTFLILSSLLYNVAYYFIIIADIKARDKLLK